MDSYPGDLLAGVFPLVFAVNAILPVAEDEKDSSFSADSNDVTPSNDHASNSIMQEQPPPPPPSSKSRGLFDKFLDALAASLGDEEDDPPSPSESRVPSFLSHSDEPSSSSDEESNAQTGITNSRKPRRSFGVTASPSFTHTRLGVLRGSIRSNQVDTPLSTAYARALQLMDGPQGFFQRARVISISARHGFPPSKDPEGTQNRAVLFSQSRNNTTPISIGATMTAAYAEPTEKASQITNIEGILPQGWLEKHVHALPSVLLVVTTFDPKSTQHQGRQDKHLCETVEHLRYSLAPKRECRIQLVCLAAANVSILETDEWVSEIMKNCHLTSSCVTVLDTQHDLQCADSPGIPASPPTRKLHKTVRDASLSYYLGQARRVKRKNGILEHEQRPALLPLAVRYCFKIGIFYEFLLRHEKSTKYLAQAYRHLEYYYRHFILSSPPLPVVVNPQGEEGHLVVNHAFVEKYKDKQGEEEDDEEGGIEVAVANSPNPNTRRVAISAEEETASEGVEAQAAPSGKVESPPSDMAHQCRAIADWLNLKLLQSGFLSAAFSSSENGGLIAAASQWRRHSMIFLSKPDKENPIWNHWTYVVHQRLVMAQLVERRPPRESSLASTLTGTAKDEVLLRCSAWRNYEAAAEAMLSLGVEVEKAKQETDTEPITSGGTTLQSDKSMRPPFVGSIDSEGLVPKFHEECKRNHRELALEMVLHSVSIFESELKKEAKKSDGEEDADSPPPQRSLCRAGARVYYLAGGILLGMEKFEEATRYLEKAARFAAGWNGLELVIRRMLIECYEKHLPTQQTEATEEQRENVTNMILDSYFNSKLSSENLRRALDNFSILTGGTGTLKWRRECTDDSDSSMPFSFLVTFPGATHATAGDVVTASVTIRSNLDYALHINSVTLLSMAGRIPIPSSDLLCAKYANDGSDGGIIVQAQSTIFISTMIDVPKDIDSIASDESGNGGEKQGTPGKGSFSKSARPRASGLTSAGGARFIDERSINDDDRAENDNAQWSLRYLGGKPLRCDGMSLVFYPLHAEKVAATGAVSRVNLIDLEVVHKKAMTHAPIKRTPFEEDNYVSSAWSRPYNLPLLLGPRCLRVLGPMPQMVVTNLSNPLTNGTAIEGTVNRVLLRLQAGPKEECGDIRYKIACSNTLLSIDGTTSEIDRESHPASSETNGKQGSRTPVLVTNSSQGASSGEISNCNYELPAGWIVVDSGQGTIHDVVPEVSSLKAGESTYIFLDLYRPPSPLESPIDGTIVGDSDICQTDFDIAITYRQSRPSAQLRRRRSCGRLNDKEESDFSDLVFLEYSGSVLWAPPISAEFSDAGKGQESFPSGSSHSSNFVDKVEETGREESDSSPTGSDRTSEIALVNGQRVSMGCVLIANAVSNSLSSEIEQVSFENHDGHSREKEAACDLRLISDCQDDVLYGKEHGDVGCKLDLGSKFNFNYTVEATMRAQSEENNKAHVCLGVVCVDWKPVPLTFREGKSMAHGPLVLTEASTIKFWGPRCYIERAPFEVSMDSFPSSPRLSTPFDLSFRITNKTPLHQKLTVSMNDAPVDEEGSDLSEGLLLSGLVNGEICLAPHESQILWYTALATRAGKMEMPAIAVSTVRYKTWVVNNTVEDGYHIFVLP